MLLKCYLICGGDTITNGNVGTLTHDVKMAVILILITMATIITIITIMNMVMSGDREVFPPSLSLSLSYLFQFEEVEPQHLDRLHHLSKSKETPMNSSLICISAPISHRCQSTRHLFPPVTAVVAAVAAVAAVVAVLCLWT